MVMDNVGQVKRQDLHIFFLTESQNKPSQLVEMDHPILWLGFLGQSFLISPVRSYKYLTLSKEA